MFKKKIVIWIYFSHFLSMFWFKCPGSKWRVRNGPGSICLGSKCQGSKRVDPGSVLWYLMICLHCFMLHLPVCAILGFTVSITQCFHDIYIYNIKIEISNTRQNTCFKLYAPPFSQITLTCKTYKQPWMCSVDLKSIAHLRYKNDCLGQSCANYQASRGCPVQSDFVIVK